MVLAVKFLRDLILCDFNFEYMWWKCVEVFVLEGWMKEEEEKNKERISLDV